MPLSSHHSLFCLSVVSNLSDPLLKLAIISLYINEVRLYVKTGAPGLSLSLSSVLSRCEKVASWTQEMCKKDINISKCLQILNSKIK